MSATTALRALHDVPDLNVPDVGVVTVWFANGAIGCIANTCMLRMGYTVGLHVLTPNLIVELTSGGVKFLEPNRTEEIRHQRNGHFCESAVFVKAVRTKNQALIRSDYADAVKTLAVTLAALEPAEKGGVPVPVPSVRKVPFRLSSNFRQASRLLRREGATEKEQPKGKGDAC